MKTTLIISLIICSLSIFGQSMGLNNNTVTIDATGKISTNGDLHYALRHCEIVGEGLSYTPNLTQNVWLKMTPGWTVTEADYITAVNDSITITTAGSYMCWFTISFQAGNNEDYDVGIFKNGVLIRSIRRTGLGTGNYVGGQIGKYMDNLIVGDDISFRIRNITNSNDPTIIGDYCYMRKEY